MSFIENNINRKKNFNEIMLSLRHKFDIVNSTTTYWILQRDYWSQDLHLKTEPIASE